MSEKKILYCPVCGREHHLMPKQYECRCVCAGLPRLCVVKFGDQYRLVKEDKYVGKNQ